jgi:hypothetical protein
MNYPSKTRRYGLVVKAPASKTGDPRFKSLLRINLYFILTFYFFE